MRQFTWFLSIVMLLSILMSGNRLLAQRITYDNPDVVTVDIKTGRILVGPNPDSVGQMFNLLRSGEIRDAVGLEERQVEAISNAILTEKTQIQELASKGVPNNEIAGAIRSNARLAYDEILTPNQKLRMRQIVFRIEVSVMGLASALTEGRLGEEVEINENQINRIQKKGKEIEARTKAEILAILKRAEGELLSELKPEQKLVAEEALGEFFVYSNIKSMQDLRSEMKAQAANEQNKSKTKLK